MSDETGFEKIVELVGEAPSPEFVASLRLQLVDQLNDAQIDQAPAQLVPIDTHHNKENRVSNKRYWLGSAAAAAVAVVVGGVIAFGGEDETLVVANPAATAEAGTEVSQALDVVGEFFTRFNAGDHEGVLSLFTEDAVFSWRFLTEAPSTIDREEWTRRLASTTSQGYVLTTPACANDDEQTDVGVAITCTYDTLDAITLAVEALPVPTQTTFTVTSVGIVRFHQEFAGRDFLHVARPFESWMLENNPDANLAEFGTWPTLEAARSDGVETARYAQEWAAYLEATGCGYLDSPCTQSVALAREYMTARDSWDTAAVRALIQEGVDVEGYSAADELIEFERATGWRYRIIICTESSPSPAAQVKCSYVFENDWTEALGIAPITRSQFDFVIVEDRLESVSHTPNFLTISNRAWDPFLEWLRANHPDDITTMLDFVDNAPLPKTSPEAIMLWISRTEGFVGFASQS